MLQVPPRETWPPLLGPQTVPSQHQGTEKLREPPVCPLRQVQPVPLMRDVPLALTELVVTPAQDYPRQTSPRRPARAVRRVMRLRQAVLRVVLPAVLSPTPPWPDLLRQKPEPVSLLELRRQPRPETEPAGFRWTRSVPPQPPLLRAIFPQQRQPEQSLPPLLLLMPKSDLPGLVSQLGLKWVMVL